MTTTTAPEDEALREMEEELGFSIPARPAVALDERIEPASEEYLKVDTVPGYRADGTVYDHTRVRVGTGFGSLVVPFVRHRGLVYLGMVHQHRPAVDLDTWEFVRGGTSNHSQEEANRELREETGLVVQDTALRYLGVLHPDTGLLTTQVAVWVASVPVDQVNLTTRHVEHESGAQVRWLRPGQVEGLILNKKLSCGMSLAAYAMGHSVSVFHEAF